MDFGKRLCSLRTQRGLTQEELSHKLGIRLESLSHYENDRRKPDHEALYILAQFFGVSVDYLLGRTNNTQAVLDDDVREFVDNLELSDEAILRKFSLTAGGIKLTLKEAKRFIAFVRSERMINL